MGVPVLKITASPRGDHLEYRHALGEAVILSTGNFEYRHTLGEAVYLPHVELHVSDPHSPSGLDHRLDRPRPDAYIAMAYIVTAYMVIEYLVAAYIVMAYMVMVCLAAAYIVTAYIVIAHPGSITVSIGRGPMPLYRHARSAPMYRQAINPYRRACASTCGWTCAQTRA